MDRDEKARELARLVLETPEHKKLKHGILLGWLWPPTWYRMRELAKQLLDEDSPEQ